MSDTYISAQDFRNRFIQLVKDPAINGASTGDNAPDLWGKKASKTYYTIEHHAVRENGHRRHVFVQVPHQTIYDEKTAPKNWYNPEAEFYTSKELKNGNFAGPSVHAGDKISAAQVYNVIMAAARMLSGIRTYKIEQFYDNHGNFQLVQDEEGKAAFRNRGQNFPAIANPFAAGAKITLSGLTDFLKKIYAEWSKLYQNQVYYRYECCHSNCHNDCHGSGRGRR